MKFLIKVLVLVFVVAGISVLMSYDNRTSISDVVKEHGVAVTDSTPSIKMYNSIIHWASEYDVPIRYAFALAYHESRYGGPAHIKYKHNLISKSGAMGPMQIKYSTAKKFIEDDEKISKRILRNDIDFNVMISMRILHQLHTTYGTWGKAFGAYNTGKPIVNKYAKDILYHKLNWISFGKI